MFEYLNYNIELRGSSFNTIFQHAQNIKLLYSYLEIINK